MDSALIMQSQAFERLMKKIYRILEDKMIIGISSLLSFCRFDLETELGEMGLGNLLMLLSLRALSEGDQLLMAVISQFCPDLAPLDSCHLAAWIKEDFNIPQELLARAARQALSLSHNPAIHLPPSLLTHILQPSTSQTIHSADEEGAGGPSGVECPPPAETEDGENIGEQAETNSPAAVIEHEEGSAGPSGVDSPPPPETEEQKVEEPEGLDKKLVKAVIRNEGEILCRLVAGGGDVNTLSPEGESLLHLAVKGRAKEAVEALLRLGARLNRRDRERKTPLHWAIEQDSSELVEMLLDSGADATVLLKGGQTLLMFALSTGSLFAAKALLSRGVPVDQLNSNGETALFEAMNQQQWHLGEETAHHGQSLSEKATAAIRLLADYKAKMNLKNRQGNTPLHIAARTADCSVIQILVQSGAEINAKNSKGETALHIAVEGNSLAVVEKLATLKADINCKNSAGEAPLHIAVSEGFVDIVDLLLEQKATIDVVNENGCTPLYIAAEKGRKELVEMLTKENANVNLCAKNGTSVLYGAASNSIDDCFFVLRKLGAVWSDRDFKEAVVKGNVKLLELLRESGGVDVNARDSIGNTALHWAADAGKEAAVSWLLDLGLDINAKGWNGWTSLHYAACSGHLPVVQLLIDRGAAINSRDSPLGRTPLSYSMYKHPAVAELLKSKGGVE